MKPQNSMINIKDIKVEKDFFYFNVFILKENNNITFEINNMKYYRIGDKFGDYGEIGLFRKNKCITCYFPKNNKTYDFVLFKIVNHDSREEYETKYIDLRKWIEITEEEFKNEINKANDTKTRRVKNV